MANKNGTKIITKDLVIYLGKIILSTVLMSEIVIIINMGLSKVLFGGIIKDVIRMVIGAFSGVIVYFGTTILFKANEIKGLLKKD